MNENFLYAYDHEYMEEVSTQDAKLEGIKKGIIQEKIRLAKEMLQNNIEEDMIIKCTGLNDKELESLKK